jgi:hypothetical protein
MKTRKIRLIAMVISLAAAIMFTATPAEAQRRNSKDSREEKVATQKSSNKNSRDENKTSTRNGNSRKQVEKAPSNSKKWDMEKASRTVERSDRVKSSDTRNQKTKPSTERKNSTDVERTQPTRSDGRNINRSPERVKKDIPADNRERRENAAGIRERRENPSDSRDRNYDRPDRNTPSKEYKGSDRFWSGNERSDKFRNTNRGNRDYRNYSHWDRNWEGYRWNDLSWNDYYNVYKPYSFRYDRHYYHHPAFGDVIRRFSFKPIIFIHNRIPFYCYDGYFFNYHKGVGYVLTDLPYGIVFPELPYGYEEVYINGYLYFRLGNLFFEYVGDGYRLVYYPERFFANR